MHLMAEIENNNEFWFLGILFQNRMISVFLEMVCDKNERITSRVTSEIVIELKNVFPLKGRLTKRS